MLKNSHLVIGLGETGFSCIKYLRAKNIPVVVADTRDNPPHLADCRKQFPEVEIHLGKLSEALSLKAATIVVSPGISLEEPCIQKAREKNIPIVGDIELFVRDVKAPIVAITGSNGKTTLTTLMGELINHAGKKAIVCGNIGMPVLDVLAQEIPDFYVLELSSFQLETTYSLCAKVAILTNLSPDHMDRYETLDDYLAAKQRVYLHCDYAIVNADEKNTWEKLVFKHRPIEITLQKPLEKQWGVFENTLSYGKEKLIAIADLLLQERFNNQNFLAALAIGTVLQLPMKNMLATLKHFAGLPHRCQRVKTNDDIIWYNDSKGTNPGAVIAAIESVYHRHHPNNIILIAGGDGKGVDFSILQAPVKATVSHVIVLGKDAALLQAALQDSAIVTRVNTVREAVAFAKTIAQKKDVVLLSPACSSLDQYKSYAERGNDFMKAITARG
ncbi:MAG: UDP-N-acetylmuramoyl-L-alanine--D-glutamate ligase [Coxiellaceae bacterium]|nr:UDP-N-acetylmuramoyl-L-alanine--D-glutamate ligase [Coxiellaceae bacterium]